MMEDTWLMCITLHFAKSFAAACMIH